MKPDSRTLLPFGDKDVATVHSSGIVEIRLIDNCEQRTLASRMMVHEFARIAKIVFGNVCNDVSNDQEERDRAGVVNGSLMNFIAEWGN